MPTAGKVAKAAGISAFPGQIRPSGKRSLPATRNGMPPPSDIIRTNAGEFALSGSVLSALKIPGRKLKGSQTRLSSGLKYRKKPSLK